MFYAALSEADPACRLKGRQTDMSDRLKGLLAHAAQILPRRQVCPSAAAAR